MIKKDVFDDAHYPPLNLGNILNYVSAMFLTAAETKYKGRKNTI